MVAASALLVRADLIVLLAGDEAAVGQLLVASLLDLGVLDCAVSRARLACACATWAWCWASCGLRLLQRRLEGPRVDGEQQVPGLHFLPFA